MKKMNLKNVIAVLSMVLVSVVANARDFSDLVNVSALKAEKKALIRVMNPTDKSIVLRVEDENGNIVYFEENIKDSAYVKVLNLRNLENGNYKLSIKRGNNIVEKTLEVSDYLVTIKTKVEASFNVNYKSDSNVLLVEVNKSNAVVTIYNSGTLVYEDIVSEDKIKQFDLSNLEKGKYTAAISTQSNTYTYSIEVK